MPIGLDDAIGLPVADAEPVRHDARSRPQIRAQLRSEALVHLGKKKQGHHGGLGQFGEKQILLAKLDEVIHPGFPGVAACSLEHPPVELDSDATRTVVARSGNGDTAVAGAKIVDDVGAGHPCKPQHRIDHRLRGREVQRLGFVHLGGVGLAATRGSTGRVRVLRSNRASGEQCRNDEDYPVFHDSVPELSALEHRPDLTKINTAGGPRTTLQAMNAGDIMVTDVVSVGPDTPVREVALLMLERRISGLPVVDGERRVLGVVSESDLIRRPEIGTYKSPAGWLTVFLSQEDSARDFVKTHGLLASEVMSRPAICVAPATPLADVVQLFERHRVKRLPVVERGALAGLVTRAELLRALVARQAIAPATPGDEEIRDRIEATLRSEAWAPSTVVNVQVTDGVVQLWGAVSSNAQRDALVLAIRGTPGVKEVQPHLGRTMAG